MTEGGLTEAKVREIAESAATKAVDLFCQRLGIDNIGQTRRNLDYLDGLMLAAEGRSRESRKTIFQVLGGVALMILGYLAAAFGLKGHAP